MKQVDLAEKLGISKSYVSEIEKGTKSPSMDIINKYSDLFKIAPSSILFFSENLDSGYSASKRQARKVVSSKILSLLEFIEAKRVSDNEEE